VAWRACLPPKITEETPKEVVPETLGGSDSGYWFGGTLWRSFSIPGHEPMVDRSAGRRPSTHDLRRSHFDHL
jgi:hypothetical protein